MTKKRVTMTVTATRDASSDTPEMLVSTPDVDRDDDRLIPDGADLTAFRKNPALVWSHNYGELPIGTVTRIDTESRGLRAQWRWLEGDDFAARVRNAWDQGVVRAASVGFMPKEWKPNDFGGQDILAWDLLEISLCAVPANPFATRILKGLRLFEDPRQDLFLEVTDCSPGQSAPSSLFGKEKTMYRFNEPVYDVDKNQIRALVEKAINEARSGSKSWDSPGWRAFRERRRIIEENDQRFKRVQAEGYRRLRAQAEWVEQQSKSLQFCPVVPPPMAYY